jgi:predicted acyl esterase
MVIIAVGILLAGNGYSEEKNIIFPSKYPAEWGVIFAPRPPLKIGVGFCEPPYLGGGACWGNYLGFNPSTTTFTEGTNVYPYTFALPCDIAMDRDVPITLRDGVTIYVHVFRPAGGSNLPAIIAWGPYTKSVPQDLRWVYQKGQVPPSWVSGLAVFEGPDPGFWCCNGYAVINVDPRGVDMSKGDMHYWGMVDAADGYEVIEWAASQPWSNGKVGMHGASWLGIGAVVHWRDTATTLGGPRSDGSPPL